MATINEAENVPPINEIAAEIHTHAVRIQELQDRAKLAATADDKLAVALELASEVTETIMPLFADFSKATAMELDELNTEVFGIKIGPDQADNLVETLEKAKPYVTNNPELLAELEAAQALLEGEEDDDDEEGDEEDQDEEDEDDEEEKVN